MEPVLREILRANRKKQKLRFPFRGECGIAVQFICDDKRKRDWDNLATNFKPWQDALVKLGFISDDSQITDAHIYMVRHASGPKTIIDLWEKSNVTGD